MTDEKSPSPPLDPQEQLRERILADSPRLGLDDTFEFSCHPGISCFNQCCADVNIFLSPYDVLRMKKRLSVPSTEFLDTYTRLPGPKGRAAPAAWTRWASIAGRC
mgnify:CR=1 FL=1